MEKTTLYLPDELRVRLRDMATRRQQPQAEIVRDALSAYIDAHASPLPRSVGSVTEKRSVQARDAKAYVRDRWQEHYRDSRESRSR